MLIVGIHQAIGTPGWFYLRVQQLCGKKVSISNLKEGGTFLSASLDAAFMSDHEKENLTHTSLRLCLDSRFAHGGWHIAPYCRKRVIFQLPKVWAALCQ